MNRINNILTKRPQHIPILEYRYYSMLRVVHSLALLCHIYFLVLFWIVGVSELTYIQFVSIAIYSLCIYLNEKRQYLTSLVLATFEVALHQAFCVYVIGVESQYQLYLACCAMLPFLLPKGKDIVKTLLLLGSIGAFILIQYVIGANTPIQVLSPNVLSGIGIINILITGGFLGVFGMYFANAMADTEDKLNVEREKSDSLLHNMLPKHVASELKTTGKSEPKRFESMTIMFTDFKGFTELVASIPAITLVEELNDIFSGFDDIVEEEGIEKIETIGDAYLAAGGLPKEEPNHAYKCVKTAKRLIEYLEFRNAQNKIQWKMRVGIHSGPIVAGVVGKKKLTYGLFGDTINTASRFETASEPGRINVSSSTYEQIKNEFDFEYRGKIHAKGKGELDMYFVK